MKIKIKLYTDGSIVATKNPQIKQDNVASHGYIAVRRNSSGSDEEVCRNVTVVENSTITEMELLAIRTGLERVRGDHSKHLESDDNELVVEVYSDSKMAVKAFNEYIPKWVKSALIGGGVWKASNGAPVAHQQVYKDILELSKGLTVKYIHVKAHSESDLNNAVDKMVRDAVRVRIDELSPA